MTEGTPAMPDPIQIPLHDRKGARVGTALVSAEDARLAEHRWSLSDHGYAKRTACVGGVEQRVYLHRAVMGCVPGDGVQVDHIHGAKLDCRRSELRVGTHTDNAQNLTRVYGRSRFRGVCWHKAAGKWQACVRASGRAYYLGLFRSEVVAGAVAAQFRADHMPGSIEAYAS